MNNLYIFLLLLTTSIGCESHLNITPTPLNVLGPAVLTNTSDVKINSWNYIRPGSMQSPSSRLPADISFGEAPYEAQALWTQNELTVSWIETTCKTQPILVFTDADEIELWTGESDPPNCDLAGDVHVIKVRIETDIPKELWSYHYYGSNITP